MPPHSQRSLMHALIDREMPVMWTNCFDFSFWDVDLWISLQLRPIRFLLSWTLSLILLLNSKMWRSQYKKLLCLFFVKIPFHHGVPNEIGCYICRKEKRFLNNGINTEMGCVFCLGPETYQLHFCQTQICGGPITMNCFVRFVWKFLFILAFQTKLVVMSFERGDIFSITNKVDSASMLK